MNIDHRCDPKVLFEKGDYRLVQCKRTSYLNNPNYEVEKRGRIDAMGNQVWLKPEGSECMPWLILHFGDLLREAKRTDSDSG